MTIVKELFLSSGHKQNFEIKLEFLYCMISYMSCQVNNRSFGS